ncbi:MAG: DNA gyrase subunit A, partial [Stellaceae bacterium]
TSIPPHNILELCDALAHLIRQPKATVAELVELVPGPDFPTGGILVEDRETIEKAYETGRASFRVRAKWEREPLAHAAYQIVVTEIPYQVQKSRLIERVAALLEERKLPLLADIRDESTETVRLVLEPKTRNVVPDVLMESLYRATELEVRVPLNLNVIDAEGAPRVMSLKEALQAFLDHRREVLLRRSRFRVEAIARRTEILKGQLVVYLNLDEVIRIIREEDDPKARMMKRWKLSEIQVEAILNLRLRSLRRLEELAIKKELQELGAEQKELESVLADTRKQWRRIGAEIADLHKEFAHAPLAKRRTAIAAAPVEIQVPVEALVEREPVTVLCSMKGWIRAVRGRNLALQDIKYKEGDGPRFALEATTTDRLLVFATDGRFYTLSVDKLPGGRGHGEPIRLMIDLANEHDVVAVLVHRPEQKLLVAASDGLVFLVNADEVLAQTRNGKQVMSLGEGSAACAAVWAEGDTVAVVGDNRKLLLFPVSELPEMARGRGVILQR